MDDRIDINKVEKIVEIYGELRERFFDGNNHNPHQENIHFALEQLNVIEGETENYNDITECVDLFLANIHALYTLRSGEGAVTSEAWNMAVGNTSNFVYDRDSGDDWINTGKEIIEDWIDNLEVKVEIPY
ncbi:MAG: hypothetical protein ACRC6V_09435 [Bacteroidales bacterium]